MHTHARSHGVQITAGNCSLQIHAHACHHCPDNCFCPVLHKGAAAALHEAPLPAGRAAGRCACGAKPLSLAAAGAGKGGAGVSVRASQLLALLDGQLAAVGDDHLALGLAALAALGLHLRGRGGGGGRTWQIADASYGLLVPLAPVSTYILDRAAGKCGRPSQPRRPTLLPASRDGQQGWAASAAPFRALAWPAATAHLVHHIHALDHAAKHDVAPVLQGWAGDSGVGDGVCVTLSEARDTPAPRRTHVRSGAGGAGRGRSRMGGEGLCGGRAGLHVGVRCCSQGRQGSSALAGQARCVQVRTPGRRPRASSAASSPARRSSQS